MNHPSISHIKVLAFPMPTRPTTIVILDLVMKEQDGIIVGHITPTIIMLPKMEEFTERQTTLWIISETMKFLQNRSSHPTQQVTAQFIISTNPIVIFHPPYRVVVLMGFGLLKSLIFPPVMAKTATFSTGKLLSLIVWQVAVAPSTVQQYWRVMVNHNKDSFTTHQTHRSHSRLP